MQANWGTLLFLLLLSFGPSLFVTYSHLVKDPDLFRFVPPFVRGMDFSANSHLGGEYYRIATAIVEGRGFSDPFGYPSGPTAWMPPVYCYFLAGLILLIGNRFVESLVVLLLKGLVLFSTGLLVCEFGKDNAHRASRASRLFFLTLLSFLNFGWLYQFTHDSWLIMLLVNLILVFGYRLLQHDQSTGWYLKWGLLGGITALTQPILSSAWFILTLWASLRRKSRTILVACLPFAAFVGIWVGRNHVVFDRIILVKSNLWFDVYQANCSDPDGVIDELSFGSHPYNQGPYGLFGQIGESQYLDLEREKALACLADNPRAYLDKVLTRVQAAGWKYYAYNPQKELPAVHRLYSLIYPLPFLSLILLLILCRRQLPIEARVVIALYALFCAPYVLMSFYGRYMVPMLGPQILLCSWAVEQVLAKARIASGRTPSPSPS